jgi:spore coat polysaccharide biosynthesis protein SpsF
MKVAALKKLCEEKDETDTECWGSYFTSSDAFKIHQIDVEKNLRHPTLKTSLDYPEDYEFMKQVFGHLYTPDKIFSMVDIINLVKQRPDILSINANVALVKRWRDHQQTVA